MKILNALFTSLAILLLSSCLLEKTIVGNEKIINTIYDYSDFNTLELSNSFNIKIIQSTSEKIIVKCDENLKEFLDISKDNNTLKIKLISGYNYRNIDLTAEVYINELEHINSSGACKILMNEFKTENLNFDLSGATKIIGNLHVSKDLNIESSGASKIELTGDFNNVNFDLTGASKFSSENLKVHNLLNIESSGASKINIKGEAKSANLNFSGASKIAAENFIISENIDIKSSGASHISITANKNITIDLSGASKCNLYGTGVISKESSSGASKINKQLN
tara:strand:+ start:99 stop:941 length:843 start_codon:yes stop_codon:yes gene_type:complete